MARLGAPLSGRRGAILAFMLGGIVSSELAWIIRLDNKRTDFERQTNAQLAISRNIIARLEKGERVDVQKELLRPADADDRNVEAILENLEAVDTRWAEAKTSPSAILKQNLEGAGSEPAKAAEKGKWL